MSGRPHIKFIIGVRVWFIFCLQAEYIFKHSWSDDDCWSPTTTTIIWFWWHLPSAYMFAYEHTCSEKNILRFVVNYMLAWSIVKVLCFPLFVFHISILLLYIM